MDTTLEDSEDDVVGRKEARASHGLHKGFCLGLRRAAASLMLSDGGTAAVVLSLRRRHVVNQVPTLAFQTNVGQAAQTRRP